jgi:hypothetical protein
MAKEDEAERSRYARRPMPARPKGAVEIKPNGIRPVGAEAPYPLNPNAPIAPAPLLEDPTNHGTPLAPKFEFRDSGEEPLPSDNIPKTLDEGSAFHIFSLVLRALRKVDKPTRRRIIGLINELELEEK